MDLCAKYAGADFVVQKFVPEFMDDLVSRKFEEVMLSETISVSTLVHKAVCVMQNALMQCETTASGYSIFCIRRHKDKMDSANLTKASNTLNIKFVNLVSFFLV